MLSLLFSMISGYFLTNQVYLKKNVEKRFVKQKLFI